MTAKQYQFISRPFSTPGRKKALQTVNQLLTGIDFLLYPALVAWQFAAGGAWMRSILGAGIPFVLLSLFRKLVNRPRPYEVLQIRPLLQKDSSGCSFPSRHVFSAFLIAMCYYAVNPGIGFCLLLLGAILAAIRVVGGVHYLSDVLAGAAFGIACGYAAFLY